MGTSTHLGPPGAFGPHPTFHRGREGALDSISHGLLRGALHVVLLALPFVIAITSYDLAASQRRGQLARDVARVEPALVRLEEENVARYTTVHAREERADEMQRRAAYLQARIADHTRDIGLARQQLSSLDRDRSMLEAELPALQAHLAWLEEEAAREESRARDVLALNAELAQSGGALRADLDDRTTRLVAARAELASERDLARYRR